ncbi:MAG: efflux RND transporter periplasmic adaptor subunit [Patescibacteria group bacterium]
MKLIKKIKNFGYQITKLFFRHKIWGSILILIVIGSGTYLTFANFNNLENNTSLQTEIVKKTTLTSSLSGNGQVSASNQVDLKFKASGDINYVGVTAGQEVARGTLLACLDTTDVQKNIRDAEINLETAELSYEKLTNPADELDVMQSENSLAQAKESKVSAENDLEEAYEDAFNSVSNAFLDMPSVVVGLQDILFSDDLSNGQWNVAYYGDIISTYNENSHDLSDLSYDSYIKAKDAYDNNFGDYKDTTRYSSRAEIESLVSQTYNTARDISDAIKNANNLIQLYQDEYSERNLNIKSLSTTQLNSLNNYTGVINGVLSELLSAKNLIKNKQEEIVNTTRTVAEKEGSLAELIAGADAYEIRSSQISVTQKENSLADAKADLINYYIYAPFDGVVASVDVIKGDSVSSGSSVITFITNKKQAEIVLNEIEIADVQVGQKVNLTFDAADDLVIEGQISELDTMGTVSSGVVNYGVKISFDTDDKRIKPSMSVNAEIITQEVKDVLVVSNSAISYMGDQAFINVLENGISKRKKVTVGLTTDLKSEIVSGLNDGDEIIIGQSVVTNSANSIKTGGGSGGFSGGVPSADMQVMRMMRD